VVAGRVAEQSPASRRGPTLGVLLVVVMLMTGIPDMRSPRMFPLGMVTAPPELLTGDRYMVNSTFFHPESLAYRFPDKRFIGMPLFPEQFEAFRLQFPEYRTVLWHDFGVQDELREYLVGPGGFELAAAASNSYGRSYFVLTEKAP
jgi:hypothetical protein